MKTTQYFDYTRKRPDRAQINEDWIKAVIENPEKIEIQSDGKIRKWAMQGGYLNMKVEYISDTDTAHVESAASAFPAACCGELQLTDKEVVETKEICENITIDIDGKGSIVSMTIEHAKDSAGLWEFSYQEMS
jgi:uncharacterized protein YuzE